MTILQFMRLCAISLMVFGAVFAVKHVYKQRRPDFKLLAVAIGLGIAFFGLVLDKVVTEEIHPLDEGGIYRYGEK